MEQNNYVGQDSRGWVVVINGQVRGHYSSQNAAENAYNTMVGPGAGGAGAPPPTGGSSYPANLRTTGDAPPYGSSSSQILADAMAASNREEFEEKMRQFNETLAWEKERFGQTKEQQDRQLWASLASQLNTTAASLHGQPRDWRKYAEYTQGGQDIFKTLWGDQPVAAFGAPTGTSNRITLADILTDLGITTAPGGGTGGAGVGGTPGAAPTREQALDAIWANKPDLKPFYEKNGWKVGTPEEQRKAVENWLGMSADADVKAAGKDPIAYVTAKGWKPIDTAGRDAALDAIWANRPDFAAAAPSAATPEQRREFVLNWLQTSQEAPVLAANRDPVAYAGNWTTAAPTAPGAAQPTAAAPTVAGAAPQVPAVQVPAATQQPTAAQPTIGEQPMGLYGGNQRTSPLLAALGLGGQAGLPSLGGPPLPVPPGTYPGEPGGGRPNPFIGPPEPVPSATPTTPSVTAPTYGAPLPFQMNPLVWDSLSDTAKQMILGAVEAGDTPSGVWTATDWLNQFNASRPKGNAPRSVQYNYGAPRSYF